MTTYNIPPMGAYILLALDEAGGAVVDESGRATSIVADRFANAFGYGRGSVSTELRALDVAGYVKRDVSGKRTRSINLTVAGKRAIAELDGHYELPPKSDPDAEVEVDEIEPEPATIERVEPALPPEQRHVVEDILAGGVNVVDTYTASNGNGHLPVNALGEPPASAIAQALLRQTVRVLSDSDTSTLIAERDALRAHNAVWVERDKSMRDELDRAQAELRELREIVHRIEVELTPFLTGQHERSEWLDARTRTDLLLLVSQAARWVTT